MFKIVNLKSEFIKYVLVLMTGTVAAQILSLLLTPIITDIYSPEQGAELGLFVRIITLAAAFATLRYEIALPIIKNDRHSFRLYSMAFKVAIIVSILALVVVIVPFGYSLTFDSTIFYLLIPVGVFFLALDNLGTNWAIRNKLYRHISYTRLSNSVVANFSKIGLGWLGFGSAGLLIGMIAGAVVSMYWYLLDLFRAKNEFKISSNSTKNLVLAKKHKEFPLVSLPHVLMDFGRDLLIALFILKLFSQSDYGLYDLSFRMLRVPVIFIGVAIGQVFFQKCSEKINNEELILPAIIKTVKTLILLSLIPFSVVFLFGEEMFAYVFSEKWREAGVFAETMSPWLMIGFVSSPITSIPVILKRQKDFFLLSAGGAVLILIALFVPAFIFNASVYTTLWIVSISQALFLIFLIYKIIGFAKKYESGLT